MALVDTCTHCGGTEIHHHREVLANSGTDMQLLPGVWAGFLGTSPGKFDVFVCVQCGHTQFFVQEEFLDRIREKWTKVESRLRRQE